MSEPTTSALLASAIAGDRSSLARLLSHIERHHHIEAEVRSALAGHPAASIVLGITGPPGAGKSTLISALLPHATAAREKTAVLAVDPSSPFSGGALLGDRVCMQGHGLGEQVFIRSMASRGENGGLARTTGTAIQLLDACGWPLIILETLGIGQVELDVMDLATLVTVVLNPGWGDTFQANKAGLTEAGDVFVINKADKEGAQQTRADLQDSLSLLQAPIPLPIVDTVAVKREGIAELWAALESYLSQADALGLIAEKQAQRRHRLLKRQLQRAFENRLDRYLDSAPGRALLTDTLAGNCSVDTLQDAVFAQLGKTD